MNVPDVTSSFAFGSLMEINLHCPLPFRSPRVVQLAEVERPALEHATDASGRLKKFTAKVNGVMVGRQGYGTATVKDVGSWPVAIQ